MRRVLYAWTVETDPDATRRAYDSLDGGAARRCGCTACLNFDAARPDHFPEGFLHLLQCLDIEPRKEAAVRLVSEVEGRQCLYAGTYGFCGTVLAGRPFRGFPLAREEVDVFERVGPDAHVALRPWTGAPVPWTGDACVRVDFLVVLPRLFADAGPQAAAACPSRPSA